MIRCIIVDDEPLAGQLIESYIDRIPFLASEGRFESAADALPPIIRGDAEVVFLDINMPLLNGLDFARLIPSSTRIVYITAYDQYALEGFRVNALDYLLKPVSFEEFTRVAAKIKEWKEMKEAAERSTSPSARSSSETITVRADHRLVRLSLNSIKYVEVQTGRLLFVRDEGEPVSSIMSLKELEERLPKDRFMRIHRSFIVNLDRVEVVERSRIVFGKTYIPISDNRKEEFLQRIGLND